MNGRRATSILTVFVLMLAAIAALAQKPATSPARRAAPAAATGAGGGPAVATVGGAPLPKNELDARSEQALDQYRKSSGNRELPPEMMDLLRRQVLESMIRLQLLAFEADRTGARGSQAEAEAELKKAPVFNPGGQFSPDRFNMIRTQQKPAYDAAIAAIGRQMGARRLYAALESKYLPSDADARATASRLMTRALVDHLSLRVSEFNGSFPEPRETQVADWYAAHRQAYQRPDRATVTVAFVNSPALGDSLKGVPGQLETWNRRMRARADSVLQAIAHGASYDSATRALGEHASIVVTSDNFPGYWHGTPAQGARLFDPRNTGKAMPEAIAGTDGWLVVRVDELTPAHFAPVKDVAREIRSTLRRDSRLNHDEYEQRALYAEGRDSLAGAGWKLRYAVIDTSLLAITQPSEAEIDHFYRSHQADYSSFDPQSGAIVTRPLAELRDEIRARYTVDQRTQQARALADRIAGAWTAGKRDPAAEARAVLHDTPPIIPGCLVDTGAVAVALSDTLWKLGTPQGASTLAYARGWIVWMALERVEHVVPTFEQARPVLGLRLAQRRARQELDGARAYFATDSMRFNLGDVIHFTRFAVSPPPLLTVPLTHAEVEKWHHDHLDKYSASELVTARHILVRPANASAAADSAAKSKALDLLHRVQAGEDFGTLARTYSDDPATRDVGGDLGAFGRGAMLDQFEKAAFALDAGQVCDHPVRTEVGYHIIKCTDHAPAFSEPLPIIYSVVASDAARAKADVMAHQRTDSLLAVARTPRALLAGAQSLGYIVAPFLYQTGSDYLNQDLKPFFDQLVKLKPGVGHTTPLFVKGDGFWIAWVDSVTPPVAPSWDDARERVLTEYRRGAGRRALEAKRAELDSLLSTGWSFDSLAALWGGPERVLDVTPGRGISGMGTSAAFDSLVFGTAKGAPIAMNTPSAWLTLANGVTRVRVFDRVPPATDLLATRAATMRAAELEHRLRTYFDELKKRYPVRILDPTLRDVSLAEPPPGMTP